MEKLDINVLNIFYENIIKEAVKGRINCYFVYNVLFSTKIVEENINYDCKIVDDEFLIPTLIIKDKKKFDSLLQTYVELALEFYSDDNFEEEYLDYKMYDEDTKICKEKTIMALLFANATIEDFNDPITFLERRIAFFNNTREEELDLGFSNILDGNIKIKIERDCINNETPYLLSVVINNESKGGDVTLPNLKFGIYNNKVYIYAIQKDVPDNVNSLSKRINRTLYKTGEGFDANLDNASIYEEGNLKDVTASFLAVANIALSYFRNLGYEDIVISPFLLVRWNSKRAANILYSSRYHLSDEDNNLAIKLQEDLQSNLTEKFIRTFLRLAVHYNNIDIESYPNELDSCLHLNINHNEIICNNSLLGELDSLVTESFNSRSR